MRLTSRRNRFPCRCRVCGRLADINAGWLYAKVEGEAWTVLCDFCHESSTTHTYRADPPRGPSVPPSFAALGITASGVSEADVKAAFRRLVMVRHPDHGGDEKAFIELYRNYEAALSLTLQGTLR